MESETVTVSKGAFARILTDVETLLDDFELALDEKVTKRKAEIDAGIEKGKTEEEYYEYLSKRGIAVDRVPH